MSPDQALRELRDRLDKAHRELLSLAASAVAAGATSATARLLAKASGVTLAASYVREAIEMSS